MKICLLKFKSASARITNNIMEKSLMDLGHKLVEHSKAEIVIGIRNFFEIDKKYSDKKYILLQTEGYKNKAAQVESFYCFGPDEIWGFDIENEREKYTPLGYHPCLLFESFLPEDVDVGFMGWHRGRREDWRNKVRNKWAILNSHEDKLRGENISRARINLNLHFSDGVTITEWTRTAYFLANEQFFISEEVYCPIVVPQFNSIESYDGLVDFYLSHPKERKKRAREMTKEYRTNFDMRNILKERGL